MMPGVVAGFPRKPDNEFYVTAAVYGSEYAEFSEFGQSGSISIPHKNLQVGAPNAHNSLGEIRVLIHNANSALFFLYVEGTYASLASMPFSAIQVGGTLLTKAASDAAGWGSFYYEDSVKTRVMWALPPPLVIGASPVRVLITP